MYGYVCMCKCTLPRHVVRIFTCFFLLFPFCEKPCFQDLQLSSFLFPFFFSKTRSCGCRPNAGYTQLVNCHTLYWLADAFEASPPFRVYLHTETLVYSTHTHTRTHTCTRTRTHKISHTDRDEHCVRCMWSLLLVCLCRDFLPDNFFLII